MMADKIGYQNSWALWYQKPLQDVGATFWEFWLFLAKIVTANALGTHKIQGLTLKTAKQLLIAPTAREIWHGTSSQDVPDLEKVPWEKQHTISPCWPVSKLPAYIHLQTKNGRTMQLPPGKNNNRMDQLAQICSELPQVPNATCPVDRRNQIYCSQASHLLRPPQSSCL
jgi:hypothetical protein